MLVPSPENEHNSCDVQKSPGHQCENEDHFPRIAKCELEELITSEAFFIEYNFQIIIRGPLFFWYTGRVHNMNINREDLNGFENNGSCPNTTYENGDTLLHLAVRSAEPDAVRRLLDAGADSNAQDSDGRTPLHSALERGALPVIQTLLRHSATNLNARMHDGTTPLILALRLAMRDAFEELISAGADVNAADDDGKTALHWIAANRKNDTLAARLFVITRANSVKRLLNAGADANAQDKDGRTPLHTAVEKTALVIVQMLLCNAATNLNARMRDGSTPLILASKLEVKPIFEALINAGADLNSADNDGKTALHWVVTNAANEAADARSIRPYFVKRLLDAGADANAEDNDGRTPLHLALETAAESVTPLILRHAATNLNARTHDGRTPLIIALNLALEEVADYLISAGADVNAVDDDGKTTLHWAATSRHTDSEATSLAKPRLMKKLLDAGVDVNAQDKEGRTPLHLIVETLATYHVIGMLLRHPAIDLNARKHDGTTLLISAVRFSNTCMVFRLIRAGVDVNATDSRGNTALHWAVDVNNLIKAETLLKYGASANVPNDMGQTPLHSAANRSSAALCRLLLGMCANREVRDNMGRLPRDLAQEMDDQEIARLLLNERMPPA